MPTKKLVRKNGKVYYGDCACDCTTWCRNIRKWVVTLSIGINPDVGEFCWGPGCSWDGAGDYTFELVWTCGGGFCYYEMDPVSAGTITWANNNTDSVSIDGWFTCLNSFSCPNAQEFRLTLTVGMNPYRWILCDSTPPIAQWTESNALFYYYTCVLFKANITLTPVF